MELTINQAVKIRDDYRHLEGRELFLKGMEQQIDKIVVGPYYSDKLNSFLQRYYADDWDDRDDEEILAAALKPHSYCVYVLFYETSSVLVYDNIFDLQKGLNITVDKKKYGLQS